MRDAMALVRTTVGSEEAARTLAHGLVEARNAACVHITPAKSVYRWKGQQEEADEFLVEARCLPEKVQAVRSAMLKEHPYELPLIEVVQVTGFTPAYLEWARRG